MNESPTLNQAIADQAAQRNKLFSFAVPSNTFADVDQADSLTLTAKLSSGAALPTWLTFNSGSGKFSGTPLNGDVGSIDVRVTATDGGKLSVSDVFSLNVALAPTLLATLSGGKLTISDSATGGVANAISVTVSNNNLVITDTKEPFISAPAGGSLSKDQQTLTLPRASVTNGLEVLLNGGDDSLHAGGAPFAVTVFGGDGQDFLVGGNGADELHGGNGNDILFGGSNTDRLLGDDGNDLLNGGTFEDTVSGGRGDDAFFTRDDDVLDESADANLILSDKGLTGIGTDTFTGRFVKAILRGNEQANVLSAGEFTQGSVTIIGAGGNDSLFGTPADDLLQGGDGNDLVTGAAGNDSLEGGAGNDSLRGLDGNDVLFGDAGNDTLLGQNGTDQLTGGEGDDNLQGGLDADTVSGGRGNDSFFTLNDDVLDETADQNLTLTNTSLTGLGTDTFTRRFTAAILRGNANSNIISAGEFSLGPVTMFGGDGNDSLFGSPNNDQLFGEGGRDLVNGFSGDDTLYGGEGNDELRGLDGNDRLFGEVGNDRLLGGLGSNTLSGGLGDDTFVSGGSNVLFEVVTPNGSLTLTTSKLTNLGNDKSTVVFEAAILEGDAGNNVLDASGWNAPVSLVGAAGNDTLKGGTADDALFGGDGDDVLQGGAGADKLDGGAGNDAVTESADADFTITGLQITSTLTGTEIVEAIERFAIVGGAGNNRFDAAAASVPVILLGGNGNDTLIGGASADVLVGGNRANSATGTDSLTGGAGVDVLDNDPNDVRVGAGDSVVADVFATLPSWIDAL